MLGPNGAGKSTAISLWLGLLEPDAGEVRLLGRSPDDVESRRHVGVMMQEVGLTPELRVRELIELTASYYAEPWSTQQTLELTRIEALADRPYSKLSAGQKRQVQFALAICGRPPVLSSTSRRSASTSKRARRCGGRSARWWRRAARSC